MPVRIPFFERIAIRFGFHGRGHSLAELARRLGVEAAAISSLSVEYRSWNVRKNTGLYRRIHDPIPELKSMQRRILYRLLKRLRAYAAVHGFERGRSIVTNARPHVGKRIVCTLDLRSFFDSTYSGTIYRYFRRIGWNRAAAHQLVRLCTYEDSLPQGAPTSPRIANLVNYPMDVSLEKTSRRYGGDYTRYADDITFSFNDDVDMDKVLASVRSIVAHFGYSIQRRKGIRIRRRGQRQKVTGLVVNDGVRLPRETRRWLRAVEHRMRQKHSPGGPLEKRNEPTITESQLNGWWALRKMVDSPR